MRKTKVFHLLIPHKFFTINFIFRHISPKINKSAQNLHIIGKTNATAEKRRITQKRPKPEKGKQKAPQTRRNC